MVRCCPTAVGDHALVGAAFGGRHVPLVGGGLHQHHAGGRAALAHVVVRLADAAAAAGGEVAPDAVAREVLAGRRVLGASPWPSRTRSSSATSCASPVSVPWPISERAMRMITVSSGWITTQALTSGGGALRCGRARAKPADVEAERRGRRRAAADAAEEARGGDASCASCALLTRADRQPAVCAAGLDASLIAARTRL